MRFVQALSLFLLIPLALALVCNEVPESRALTDDVSNDIIVRSRALSPAVAQVKTEPPIADPWSPALRKLVPNDRGTPFTNPAAPFSDEDILHLISIQRK